MPFKEELVKYTEAVANGLVGVPPNETGWSSGNPLVETGTACVFLKKLGIMTMYEASTNTIALSRNATSSGFFSKLPDVASNISHDDIIGLIAGYTACGNLYEEFSTDSVIRYGKKHWWVLSTSGEFYWDALTKPWHYAYYMLSANLNPGVIAKVFLAGAVVVDALFNKTNSSDKKLMWLMLETITGKSRIIDLARRFWSYRLRKTWGTMRDVFRVYYGPNHVFSVYCGEWT